MRPWLGESLATRPGSDNLMEGQDGMGANKNRSGNNLKRDNDEDQDKQEDKQKERRRVLEDVITGGWCANH
jgi:hypothetical protein